MRKICIKTYCNLNEYEVLIANACNQPLVYTRVYGNYFSCPVCVCGNYIYIYFIRVDGSLGSVKQITYRIRLTCSNYVCVNAFFPTSSTQTIQTFSLRDEIYNLPVLNASLNFTQV